MAESSLHALVARENYQTVFNGYHINGVHYEVADGSRGWHITASPGCDPVNVYWVTAQKFFAARIHLLTEPDPEMRLEIFDEISFVPAGEKHAVLQCIANWEAA